MVGRVDGIACYDDAPRLPRLEARLEAGTRDTLLLLCSPRGWERIVAVCMVETDMIYELRVYSCLPGRLPALLKRFETQTLKIWEKHGIKQAGFWTVLIGDGNNDLHYLLAWESMAEREKKWTTFQADPAWIAARSDSERDGPILANVKSMFLQPTAFSAVK
jgi:hypothetical protein